MEILKQSEDIASHVTVTDELPNMEFTENKYSRTADNSDIKKNGAKLNKKKIEKISSKLSGIFSIFEVFQLIFL